MKRPALPCLLLVVALVLPATQALAAQAAGTAVGAKGTVYTLRHGTYGALFPRSSDTVADHTVLALDVARPDGTRQRLLVPGTEGPETEAFPMLALHRVTGAPYVIWASHFNIHSVIFIVGLTEAGWTEVVMLSGDPFSTKSRPQLVATSKTFSTVGEGGEVESHDRTVLHVLWWDDGGWGQRVLYTAVLLDSEGRARRLQILPVSEFLPPGQTSSEALHASYYQAPSLAPGNRDETVVVAFADAGTGRLATMELALVPEGLIELAEEVRDELLRPEAATLSPQQLAERARAQIVVLGMRRFQPEVVQFIADRVAAELLDSGPGQGARHLAERARAQIVVIGQSLRELSLGERARAQIVVIGERDQSVGGGGPRAPTYLAARPISTWEAPAAPDRPVVTFVSRSGEHALVAWNVEGAVRYVETESGGWSEVGTVALTEEIDRSQAYQLLRDRVEPR